MIRNLVLILVVLAAPAMAAAPEVFVNNRPFPGQVVATSDDVLLEAGALCRMLGAGFSVEADTVVLQGFRLPAQTLDGRLLVSARQVASAVGGRYQPNPATGSVDLYAFDLVAASLRARQSILEKPSLDSDAELQVLSWTVRQMMERDLGLTFGRQPVVRLGDDATMTSAGIARTAMGGAVTEPGRLVFLVRRGTNPLSAMTTLAFDWGLAWAVDQGAPAREARAQGFGLWTSYNLLQQVQAAPSAASYGAWQGEAAQAEFRRLLDLQARGGPAAVLETAR